jgi:hypothetical protein
MHHDAPIIWQKHEDYYAPVHTRDAPGTQRNHVKQWMNRFRYQGSGSAPSCKFKPAIVKIRNLSMKESCLFVLFCFVCHIEIPQTTVPLATLLALLESLQ